MVKALRVAAHALGCAAGTVLFLGVVRQIVDPPYSFSDFRDVEEEPSIFWARLGMCAILVVSSGYSMVFGALGARRALRAPSGADA